MAVIEELEDNLESSESQAKTLLEAHQDALKGGDAGAIEATALAFFSFACESQRDKEPDPTILLRQKATDFEERGDWEGAERAYIELLAIAQAQETPAHEYKAHSDLRGLYSFIGQKQRALESAEASLDAARRSECKPILGMALRDVATCWLNLDKPDVALRTADELLATLPEEGHYTPYRAGALVIRGLCNVRLHDLPQAEKDLQTAMTLLAPTSGIRLFAGTQGQIAGWWVAQAELRIQYNDFEGAVEARRSAVEFRRNVAAAPQLEGPSKFASLAVALRKLGEALLAVGNSDSAEAAFVESRDILKTIHLPEAERPSRDVASQ